MKREIIRVPNAISDRVDRLAAELDAAHPGQHVSRAAVVRALLSKALAVVDAAGGHLEGALEAVRAPGPPKSVRAPRRG